MSSETSGEQSRWRRWRTRLSVFRHVPPLIKLLWESHHVYTAVIFGLRLIRSLLPVASLWVGKLIIDAVVALREGGGSSGHLWKLIAFEIALAVISDLLARASVLVEVMMADLFSNYVSVRLMAHAATLNLSHFEDPSFYDQLERARQQTGNRVGLLGQLLSLGQDFLTLVSLCAGLFVYSPWLLLLVCVAGFPSFFGETHFATLEYKLFHLWTPTRRVLDYLRYVGASNVTAKEVQLFGLSPWLISRFEKLARQFFDVNKRLSVRKSIVGSGLSLIGTFGYYLAYVVIIMRTVDGYLTIGTLTFMVGSFIRTRDLIQRQLSTASYVYQNALYLKDLFDFFDLRPSIVSKPGASEVRRPIRQGVVFENVSFRYPGSSAWTLRNVSFEMRPGERVAFVGENGAGKTTLTKLLARLYDPTEGRILIDGKDLREYDLGSLRRAIGVIFQDFVRYDWRFDENIGVGEIEEVKSYLDSPPPAASRNGKKPSSDKDEATAAPESAPTPQSIILAAEKSLAAKLVARFPGGYQQMLGRRFDQGVELSGGEWQKIALARAYMRDAQVFILDEPTAALDARAEYEVFVRFSQLIAGRMAVIISHRFSAVRMADRIIVIQNGSVIENGTHAELIARGGLYAELFNLQAEHYQ
jgi:ATP-binding cassette subfamily B protein